MRLWKTFCKYLAIVMVVLGTQPARAQDANTKLEQNVAAIKKQIETSFSDALNDLFQDNLNPEHQVVLTEPITATSQDDGAGEDWQVTIPIEYVSFVIWPARLALRFDPIIADLRVEGEAWHIRYNLPEEVEIQIRDEGQWVSSGYHFYMAGQEAEGVYDSRHQIWENIAYEAEDIALIYDEQSVSSSSLAPSPSSSPALIFSLTAGHIAYQAYAQEQDIETANGESQFAYGNQLRLLDLQGAVQMNDDDTNSSISFIFEEVKSTSVVKDLDAAQIQYLGAGNAFAEGASLALHSTAAKVATVYTQFDLFDADYEITGMQIDFTEPEGNSGIFLDHAILRFAFHGLQEELASFLLSFSYSDLSMVFLEDDPRPMGHDMVPYNFDLHLTLERFPSYLIASSPFLRDRIYPISIYPGFPKGPDTSQWLSIAAEELHDAQTRLTIDNIAFDNATGSAELDGIFTYNALAPFMSVGEAHGTIREIDKWLVLLQRLNAPQEILMLAGVINILGEESFFGNARHYNLEITEDAITLNGDPLPF